MLFKNLFSKMDFTDKWQVRCPTCGRTKKLEEVGGKRVASRWSKGKRTLGRCSRCDGLKWMIIEPQPEPAEVPDTE